MIGAGLLLVALGPVILLIAGLVAVFVGRPVLFRQIRPGLHGKPFTLYKFRSMIDVNMKAQDGEMLSDDMRLTRFGRFLRNTSLDELPELINVLKGDMSLVGPRPLLMEYLPLYTQRQLRRHDVLPGITGWAQINGRNAITWEAKFAYDLWYVEHASVWLDLKILAMTVGQVLRRKGISHEGHVTMPKFAGSGTDEGAR